MAECVCEDSAYERNCKVFTCKDAAMFLFLFRLAAA